MGLPKPKSRREKYLARMCGENVNVPAGRTREEKYLEHISKNGASGNFDNVITKTIENILNPSNVTEGVGLNLNIGVNKVTHVDTSKTWLAVSEIFNVNQGDIYTFYLQDVSSKGYGFAFYGSDDVLLETNLTNAGNITRLVAIIPENAVKMRLLFPLSEYKTTCMLFKDDVEVDEFLEYGVKKEISTSQKSNHWTGKKACCYGCSITQMGGWDKLVKEYFGFSKMYNRGMGGTTLTTVTNTGGWRYSDTANYGEDNSTVFGKEGEDGVVWQNGNYVDNSRIDLIPSDVDLILVDSATNDFFNNATLGTLPFASAGSTQPTYDESTVTGALASLITKLQNHCPNAKIVVWGMTRVKSITDAENFDGESRTKAQCFFDMYEAIQDVCRKMGVYFIDTLSMTQFNANNLLDYAPDGVHFNENDKACKDVANAIISGLENVYPLS